MTTTRTLNDVLADGVTSDNPFIALFSQLRLAEMAGKPSVAAPVKEPAPLAYRGNDPMTRAVKALARAERRCDPTLEQADMLADQINEMGNCLSTIPEYGFGWSDMGLDISDLMLEVSIVDAALSRMARAATKLAKAEAEQIGR